MLISTSKFFEDNKIAHAHRANAIYSLWKIYKCLLWQIAFMLLLVNNVHEKTSQSQDRQNFESVCVLFVICTRVTTLHSCYMRMH